MTASASENKSIVLAANEDLRIAMGQIIEALSQITDIKIYANVSIRATQDAANRHFRAITIIDGALRLLGPIVQGSENNGAIEAFMWLQAIKRDLQDDLTKLTQIAENIRMETTKVDGIRTNLNDSKVKLIGALSQLSAYGNQL